MLPELGTFDESDCMNCESCGHSHAEVRAHERAKLTKAWLESQTRHLEHSFTLVDQIESLRVAAANVIRDLGEYQGKPPALEKSLNQLRIAVEKTK